MAAFSPPPSLTADLARKRRSIAALQILHRIVDYESNNGLADLIMAGAKDNFAFRRL
jgi:hypothetical protein